MIDKENNNGTIPSGQLGSDCSSDISNDTSPTPKAYETYQAYCKLSQSSINRQGQFIEKYGSKVFHAVYRAANRGMLDKLREAIDDIGKLAFDDAELASYFSSKERYPFID